MDNNVHKDPFEHTFLPVTSVNSGNGEELLPDLYYLTTQIVNVFFVGDKDKPNDWVLIDAGMQHAGDNILDVAINRFGEGCKPRAIILTHGHFDHVGAIIDLLEKWDVPIYAHELEIPYLSGKKDYPKGDSKVDGGLISEMSPIFPNHAINLGKRVKPLDPGGSLPFMNGWRYIHTPGHTPGHISLFRDIDQALIAGDAFVTVKQESLFKVIMQDKEISGPPKYFTTDWNAAWESVKKLESLKPTIAITGHGEPMAGKELTESLRELAHNFDKIAIPEHGRFVN